jgi:DNA-binding CsgD family transcriptional regulator
VHAITRRVLAMTDDEAARLHAQAHEAFALLWLDHDTAGGRVVGEAAAAEARTILAREGEDLSPRLRAATLHALHAGWEAALQAGNLEALGGIAAAALEVSAAMTGPSRLDALANAALAHYYQGRRSEALAHFERYRSEAQQNLLPSYEASAGHWSATILLELGRIGEAERLAASISALAGRVDAQSPTRGRTAALHAIILMVRSRWRTELERLVAVLGTMDPHYRFLAAAPAAVLVARIAGRQGARSARAMLDEARQCVAAVRCPRCSRELALRAAEVEARVGDPAAAADLLGSWEAMTAQREPVSSLEARWVRRLVDASSDGAGAGFAEIVAEAEARGLRLAAAWMRIDRARATKDPGASMEAWRDAGAYAEALGAGTIAELADQALRGHGVRTWRRSAAVAGELTPRERAIAERVAQGRTNPEIAAELFLSRKTVERHVSNILAKLGARNRAELATSLANSGSPG